MLGKTLRELGYQSGLWPKQDLVAVKAPVFSMSKLIGVDTYLGPEMKSTGEVMGVDRTFEAALFKALQAADMVLPREGAILLSLADQTKPEAPSMVRALVKSGYRVYATEGTAAMITAMGLPVERVPKRLVGVNLKRWGSSIQLDYDFEHSHAKLAYDPPFEVATRSTSVEDLRRLDALRAQYGVDRLR